MHAQRALFRDSTYLTKSCYFTPLLGTITSQLAAKSVRWTPASLQDRVADIAISRHDAGHRQRHNAIQQLRGNEIRFRAAGLPQWSDARQASWSATAWSHDMPAQSLSRVKRFSVHEGCQQTAFRRAHLALLEQCEECTKLNARQTSGTGTQNNKSVFGWTLEDLAQGSREQHLRTRPRKATSAAFGLELCTGGQPRVPCSPELARSVPR